MKCPYDNGISNCVGVKAKIYVNWQIIILLNGRIIVFNKLYNLVQRPPVKAKPLISNHLILPVYKDQPSTEALTMICLSQWWSL